MLVTYWGVRGSTPVPGAGTLRYGGNTACVAVEIGERILVIDAGTGIRNLGASLLGRPKQILLLLTHVHGDHVIGFPFFAPLFSSDTECYLLDYVHAGRSFSLVQLFDGIHVPMGLAHITRGCERRDDALGFLARHGFTTTAVALNHPGGALGYRIEENGRSFVHITDNELGQPEPRTTSFEGFVEFCRGADVLSHDAQWIEGELPKRSGWGHSTVDEACELALASRVRRLVLFHHAPERDDDAVDRIQDHARARLEPHGIQVTAAFEGLRIEL
jgi:phosphoribosyl 1,2-cyclic phosphodiesterase